MRFFAYGLLFTSLCIVVGAHPVSLQARQVVQDLGDGASVLLGPPTGFTPQELQLLTDTVEAVANEIKDARLQTSWNEKKE